MATKPSVKNILLVAVLATAIFIAIGYFIVRGWGVSEATRTTTPDKPVPVEIMTIQARHLPVVIESVGRLLPERAVTVSAQVPGQISRYEGDVGDRIVMGSVLVRIKPTDYELAVTEARSNLAAARARLAAVRKTHDRFEKLLPRKVISQDHFDKVEAEYKTAIAQEAQAQAGVDVAEERLRKTIVLAPFSGSIAGRHVEIGQMIGVNEPLMTLIDLRRMRVKVFIAEKDFVHVDSSDTAEVSVDAYPGRTFRGRIDRLDVKADPTTNTFGIEIVIDNGNLLLKAGLSARVRLVVDRIPDAVMIPQRAVLFRENSTEAFIVGEDQTAQSRVVELGLTQGDLVRVVRGLLPGDRLIVKGQNYVKPGTKIAIAPTP
jgi:RND family efflux transporter MFP subunit